MASRTWVTGPEIELTIASPDGPSQGATGIVDTGASVICLDRRIPVHLGLRSTNRKLMQMADGTTVQATAYAARLIIPALGFDDEAEVFGVPMHSPSSRVLIGRSFLRRYIVNYNGLPERFEFHEYRSPSYEEHDD
jgi:predicted aspartyl protease